MKTISDLSEIADLIRGKKTLVMHSGFAEPRFLAQQLAENAHLWPGLVIQTLMPPSPCPYADGTGFALQTLLPHAALREAVNEGRAQVLRESLFDHACNHTTGRHKADILLLQVSPPDSGGNHSLGISVSFMPQIVACRPLVVAMINPTVPRTGYSISADQIDYAIHHLECLPIATPSVFDETDRQIAAQAMTLLGDNITLEIGIGAIPEAVLDTAQTLKNLSIHTGLINDAVMPLVRSGKLSSPVVATMAVGSTGFYSWLDGNDQVVFRPVAETHDPARIAQIPRFHAVNGALQVDLEGNINTERVSGRIISCPGGLPDFAEGACRSDGGKSIIVLRSTAGGGKASTIVPKVECATLDTSKVDYIVTEYGIAPVRSLPPDQRAAAIRAIAHPDFTGLI